MAEAASDLEAQLARRGEDESRWPPVVGVDALEQGESEGCCLACASLCECYYVVGVAKEPRDDALLYGHGVFKSHFFDGAAQGLADSDFFK